MEHSSILKTLNQLEGNEASFYFRSIIRDSVRSALVEIMSEEVNLLCGPKYNFSESSIKRAGSEKGIYYDHGEKKRIKRPRVRQNGKEVRCCC